MKNFAKLIAALDQTTKTNAKIEALAEYFDRAPESDKLWTVAILSHRRPKRTVTTTLLRKWAAAYGEIPLWLFEESYHVVGDLAETIALVLPPREHDEGRTLTDWIEYIKALAPMTEEEKEERILHAWTGLDHTERFIFNKLITGGFRVGVSQKLMVKALSRHTGIDENGLAYRLMGNWTPDDTTFQKLLLEHDPADDISKPYPFYLAYALDEDARGLGPEEEWLAERKWDGIRGQLILREGQVFLWSRGEELVTDKFPEFARLADEVKCGVVLDGEILPFKDEKPLSFQLLQTRIGRKNVSKKILASAPVILMAYDLLEMGGEDLRTRPLQERRKLLRQLLSDHPHVEVVRLSAGVPFQSWDELAIEREKSREFYSEGLMLKRRSSPYRTGRKRGDWWKWKVDPLTIDAVMIYAQRGHGRRANLFSDFTFAVWKGEELVPFTKAYSGLTDQEFNEITTWVRRNTLERFGPVRSVKPTHVFEIAFEGINLSKRHKSGIALRFPRIRRWRKDKKADEANTLEDLHALLDAYGP